MSLPPFVMHHHQQHYSTTPSNPTPSPGLYGPSLPSSNDFFTTSHTPNLSPYPSPQGFNGLTLPPSVSVSPVNNVAAGRMMSPPMIEPTDQLIGYYFEHVRKLQFAYAGQELTQVLYLVSYLYTFTLLFFFFIICSSSKIEFAVCASVVYTPYPSSSEVINPFLSAHGDVYVDVDGMT